VFDLKRVCKNNLDELDEASRGGLRFFLISFISSPFCTHVWDHTHTHETAGISSNFSSSKWYVPKCCFIARLSYNFSATGANEIYEFRGPHTRGLVRTWSTCTHSPGTKTTSRKTLVCVFVFFLREIWAQRTVLKTVFFGWSHVKWCFIPHACVCVKKNWMPWGAFATAVYL
jgi:hypothetical protein